MNPTSVLAKLPASGEVEYPSGDGKPMAESGIHAVLFAILLSILRNYFHARAGVHVTGNIFLYYQQGDSDKKRSPDLMVIKGVADSQRERDSFKIWEEGVVPCVVIELTSSSTADEDLGPKKTLYLQLGVREYFLFDPRGEYLPRQLMGYRLVPLAQGNGDNGLEVVQQYEELAPAADGSLPSAELGLRLLPRGQHLDLVNQLTGERLLPPRDLAEKADKAEKAEKALQTAVDSAAQAEKDHKAALDKAEKERQDAVDSAAAAAKAFADEREQMAAEIARLRAALPPGPTE